jgi:FkbM family methyltransferase
VSIPFRAATRCAGLALLALAACSEPAGRSESPEPAARRDILGSETKLYSQVDEELIIRDFFQDRRDGFFVDVGAADPIEDSTTYYLEKHLGWSGIGIDALPEHAPAWQRERPKSRFFAYLVTDHAGTLDSFYRTQNPNLSSVVKDRPFYDQKLAGEELKLPTITLNQLLAEQGVEAIDFVSMDIEESEPAALAGFDIERFQPELVMVEASPSIGMALMLYFQGHGYERIEHYLERDKINWYFRPKPKEEG